MNDDEEQTTDEEFQSMHEAYIERLAIKRDMRRDIQKGDDPQKIGSNIDRYLDKHPED